MLHSDLPQRREADAGRAPDPQRLSTLLLREVVQPVPGEQPDALRLQEPLALYNNNNNNNNHHHHHHHNSYHSIIIIIITIVLVE